MELSSVGRHFLIAILALGWQFGFVGCQGVQLPGSAGQSPQGVPVVPDCSVLPVFCTFNDTLPNYTHCKKYLICGFTNNWQSRVCTGNRNFDMRTLSCKARREAQCANCGGRPFTLGPTAQTTTRLHRTTRPPTTSPPWLNPNFSTTPPFFPKVSVSPTQAPYDPSLWGSSTDAACKVNYKASCQQSSSKADPNDCSNYMQCVNKRWIKRACPLGTKFDTNDSRCIHPQDASCQKPCPRPECILDLACRDGQKVGNPLDCEKYFVCVKKKNSRNPWIPGQCPVDKPLFDSTTLRCGQSRGHCTALCNPLFVPTPITTSIPTSTVSVSTRMVTTPTSLEPPLAGKDITLTMPLEELCNSPHRTDHSSCTANKKGYIHRHPTICRKYFFCTGFLWVPGACPDLKIWSTTDSKCVPIGSTVCVSFTCDTHGQNTTLTTTSTTKATTPTTTVKSTTSSTTTTTVATTTTTPSTTSTTTTTPATTTTTTPTTTTKPTTTPTTSPTTTTVATSTVILTTLRTTPTTTPTPSTTLSTTTTSTTVATTMPSIASISSSSVSTPSTTIKTGSISTTSSTTVSSTPSRTSPTKAVDSTKATSTTTPGTKTHTTVTPTALPAECFDDHFENQRWPTIAIGESTKGTCHRSTTGITVRQCVFVPGIGAVWKKPDTQLCVEAKYQKLLTRVENLDQRMASRSGPSSTPQVETQQLHKVINELNSFTTKSVQSKRGIQAGNLNASIHTVDSITRLVQRENLTLPHVETQSLLSTVENVLLLKNKHGWKAVREQDPSRGVTLMVVMDRIIQQMVLSSKTGLVTKDNLSLSFRGEILLKDDLEAFDYTPGPPAGTRPSLDGIRDRVILEKETIEALMEEMPGDKVAVWSTYYHTINRLLPVKSGDLMNSRVLSLSMQSLPRGQVLKPPVKLHFAALRDTNASAQTHCSFWEFGNVDRGEWSDKGCKVVMTDSHGTICECDHLTNFAILLSPSPAMGIHATILSLISVIGSLLSILGMFVTICLYILSWKRVKSHHAAVLMNLCIALIIANITFLAGVERTENKMVCMVVSGMLHFFYLVAFFMMFADGIQFILYVVQVFHVRRKKETFLLILTCWVIPAVIVTISMSITKGEGYGTDKYCWLEKDTGLIAAFAVPAILVMIANFVILCKILHTISNSKGSERNNRVKATIWNIAVMMPLLGLTWIFGLFSVNDDLIYFQYIFCICNTLQGFFIFFFHCALNKKMRQAVVERFSSRSSQSSSMQERQRKANEEAQKCDKRQTEDAGDQQATESGTARGVHRTTPRGGDTGGQPAPGSQRQPPDGASDRGSCSEPRDPLHGLGGSEDGSL